MSETEIKYHRISPNLYNVLYLVKILQNNNLSYYHFKLMIRSYRDEIQKLKRPKLNNKKKEGK